MNTMEELSRILAEVERDLIEIKNRMQSHERDSIRKSVSDILFKYGSAYDPRVLNELVDYVVIALMVKK